MENSTNTKTLIDRCKDIRQTMIGIEADIIDLKLSGDLKSVTNSTGGEAIANIMLAYRHAEDARMRLGKVIQAMDGGTSIYDKPKE